MPPVAVSDPSWQDQDPQIPKSIWYHTDALHVGFRIVRPLVEPSEEEKARQVGQDASRDRSQARSIVSVALASPVPMTHSAVWHWLRQCLVRVLGAVQLASPANSLPGE